MISRTWRRTAVPALLLLATAPLVLSAQTSANAFAGAITAEPLGRGVYQLSAGSNALLVVGPTGTVLVDSLMFNPDRLAQSVRAITPLPVRTLILTHAHRDHTGGAATFGAMGATVIATSLAARRMAEPSVNMRGGTDPAVDRAGWPTRTYAGTKDLTVGGVRVRFIPVRASHTDGDAMVFFPDRNVLVLGDLHHSHEYPVYDAQNGCRCGSYEGNLQVYDQALRLADDRTKIIAGHGGVTDRAEVAAYVAMLRDVRARVQAMIRQGATKEQVIAARLLDGNPAVQPGGPDNRDAFIATLYTALYTGLGR